MKVAILTTRPAGNYGIERINEILMDTYGDRTRGVDRLVLPGRHPVDEGDEHQGEDGDGKRPHV